MAEHHHIVAAHRRHEREKREMRMRHHAAHAELMHRHNQEEADMHAKHEAELAQGDEGMGEGAPVAPNAAGGQAGAQAIPAAPVQPAAA